MRFSIMKNCLLVLPVAVSGWQAANAQEPWTASVHVGSVDVSRLVRDSGPWWSEVDDDTAALGVSLAYDVAPMLGLRVMYERADDLAAANQCPPDAICPAVAIREEVDFTAWHAAVVPRYTLAPDWSIFGTLGAKRWEIERDDILPDDSGTEFSYGAGITWRAMPRVEVGLEYQGSAVDYDAVRLNLGWRF